MDQITRWEWHGNAIILTLFCLSGVLLPFGVVYFVTNLLRIQEQVEDSSKLSAYLQSRSR